MRIPLSAGTHSLTPTVYRDQELNKVDFDVEVAKGQMVFRSYHSLEGLPLGY